MITVMTQNMKIEKAFYTEITSLRGVPYSYIQQVPTSYAYLLTRTWLAKFSATVLHDHPTGGLSFMRHGS